MSDLDQLLKSLPTDLFEVALHYCKDYRFEIPERYHLHGLVGDEDLIWDSKTGSYAICAEHGITIHEVENDTGNS